MQVFPNRVGAALLIEHLILATLWFFLALFRPYAEIRLPFLVVYSMLTPMILAERRRAIIFTGTEVIYRPTLGGLVRVSLANIAAVRLSTMVRAVWLRAASVGAAELTLVDGQKQLVPLDFPGGLEIHARLPRGSKQQFRRLPALLTLLRLRVNHS